LAAAFSALVRSQSGVVVFEVKDAGDAGSVDAGTDEGGDAGNAVQVVGAVTSRPASCALWVEQSASFPQSDGLDCRSG